MLSRVRSLRRHLSSELGFLIPPVHISDNLRLKPREYLFSLRGVEIGGWQIEGAQLLAVSGEPRRRPLPGKETREPAFGVPALWIAPALEDQAIAAGYSVVDGGHGHHHASWRTDPPSRLRTAGPWRKPSDCSTLSTKAIPS